MLNTFQDDKISRNGVILEPKTFQDFRLSRGLVLWSVEDNGQKGFPFAGYLLAGGNGRVIYGKQRFIPGLEKLPDENQPGSDDLWICHLRYWLATGLCRPETFELKADSVGKIYLYNFNAGKNHSCPLNLNPNNNLRGSVTEIGAARLEPKTFRDRSRGVLLTPLDKEKRTLDIVKSYRLFKGGRFLSREELMPVADDLAQIAPDRLPGTYSAQTRSFIRWLATGEGENDGEQTVRIKDGADVLYRRPQSKIRSGESESIFLMLTSVFGPRLIRTRQVFPDGSRGACYWPVGPGGSRPFPFASAKLFSGRNFITKPKKILFGIEGFSGKLPLTNDRHLYQLAYWFITGQAIPRQQKCHIKEGKHYLYSLKSQKPISCRLPGRPRWIVWQPVQFTDGLRGIVDRAFDKTKKCGGPNLAGLVLARNGRLFDREEVIRLKGGMLNELAWLCTGSNPPEGITVKLSNGSDVLNLLPGVRPAMELPIPPEIGGSVWREPFEFSGAQRGFLYWQTDESGKKIRPVKGFILAAPPKTAEKPAGQAGMTVSGELLAMPHVLSDKEIMCLEKSSLILELNRRYFELKKNSAKLKNKPEAQQKILQQMAAVKDIINNVSLDSAGRSVLARNDRIELLKLVAAASSCKRRKRKLVIVKDPNAAKAAADAKKAIRLEEEGSGKEETTPRKDEESMPGNEYQVSAREYTDGSMEE
ncbi:MAG: hypothetical protein NTZ10_04345 [Candidatus Saganbacteria bacterium]|nr:hypothetical protein [Candidatus Saganbacteria bacterium]